MEIKPFNNLGKKAQMGQKINKILIIILTVVILFQVFASLVPEAQSAGTQFGDVQTCSDAGGSFNTTQGLCLNGTTPADVTLVAFNSIPVNSLFSSNGVVILLLMVGLLIIVVRAVTLKSGK